MKFRGFKSLHLTDNCTANHLEIDIQQVSILVNDKRSDLCDCALAKHCSGDCECKCDLCIKEIGCGCTKQKCICEDICSCTCMVCHAPKSASDRAPGTHREPAASIALDEDDNTVSQPINEVVVGKDDASITKLCIVKDCEKNAPKSRNTRFQHHEEQIRSNKCDRKTCSNQRSYHMKWCSYVCYTAFVSSPRLCNDNQCTKIVPPGMGTLCSGHCSYKAWNKLELRQYEDHYESGQLS